MKNRKEQSAGEILYKFTSFGPSYRIETTLLREKKDRLSLRCRREGPEGSEAYCLMDLGRREADCLRFARAVAESHTHPRVLAELWEEFF